MTIAGYNFREAGGSAVMEIADCLATAMAYIDIFLKRGLDIDSFAPRIAFFLSAHNDFFEEIAKFRAMRRMWSKIMRERYGAKDPRSWLMRFHTQTSGSTLTAQQPENNIIRTTLQALAAVLGGTQSLHTNSYDEALGLPTERAARIALRTQQIIAHESGVTNTVDPLGGSYFVESLTNSLEKKAWEMISDIEKQGGMFEAVKRGIIQKMKDDFVQRYYREIERGERIVVGVNQYKSDEKTKINVFRINPRYEREQVKNLRNLRKYRDENKVKDALSRLKDAHIRRQNTIEATIDAALAYATVGEISECIREVWGEAKEPDVNVRLYIS
jgi:methylmalonyl-CoA mutase N-terminal domain/subunit